MVNKRPNTSYSMNNSWKLASGSSYQSTAHCDANTNSEKRAVCSSNSWRRFGRKNAFYCDHTSWFFPITSYHWNVLREKKQDGNVDIINGHFKIAELFGNTLGGDTSVLRCSFAPVNLLQSSAEYRGSHSVDLEVFFISLTAECKDINVRQMTPS